MSKKCPTCYQVTDDSQVFCSQCGTRLVDLVDEPALNIGDGNAISGGVNIDSSKTITSHDTHYHSTIHERTKSDSELKLEATNQVRSKAEEIISERGRLDSVALAQLRPFALQLGIDDDTFKSIIKDVRSNRNGGNTGIGAVNARYLQQAQQAVQTNDMDALSNHTARLEAMAAISQDDNVQYLYYLTLSLLYPIKSMEVYERQTDENYWRTFWAIVSYIRTGKYAEATKGLTNFEPLRFEKSEDDQNLLEAYSNIMMDDKDAAQAFLDDLLGEPSEQIRPLLRAIESRLYEEEVDNLEARFYIERVLSKSEMHRKSSKITESTPPEEDKSEEISAEAMYELAEKYSSPDETEANQKLGLEWLLKAAELGYAEAQEWAGQVYESGYYSELEVTPDFTLAEQYYKNAISNGRDDSKLSLSMLYWTRGDMILDAHGLAKSREAFKWYELAAKAEPSNIGPAMQRMATIYSNPSSPVYDMASAFKCCERALMSGDDDIAGEIRRIMGLCYAGGFGCIQDMNKAIELMRKAEQAGNEEAQQWLENNVNTSVPEPDMEAILSNMRLLNTINKIDVRGKLNINNAMGKTFDVTVQWNFWDFGRLYTGKELLVDTITASYEFTEWKDFRFGVFNYDSIRPHSSPDKHEGECIIRVHEKESKDIIGQVSIPCNVEFKVPLFGDPKVQYTNYIFNEPNN